MSASELRCCCGRDNCAYLAHNYAILSHLERDVHEAGKAGQALLERHEKHISDSSLERERLLGAMETLEKDKVALEASNARIIDENRTLLDQLEEMNSAITDSDLHITSLKTTLESTQHEIRRLSSLAHKAAQLEMELTSLEAERAKLDTELASNEQDKKSAVHRWKKAEATIGQLQDQIDDMEKEARDERERHEDVLTRVERQRTVNLHLSANKASARASGVATVSGDGAGAGVVTHFVKDILQDNSNLQLGILELKELLVASNSEVSNLRSQLEYHQPANESILEGHSLENEMKENGQSDTSLEPVPELHVHHHYHQQRQAPRKARKRRPGLPTGQLLRFPTSAIQESNDRRGSRGYSSVAATILSNTSVSVPTNGHRPRWSMQSTATESSYAPSSFSTSPRHPSSIFDNFDATFDSTRPTTPSSSAPGSPILTGTNGPMPEYDCNPDDIPLYSPLTPHLRQPSYLGDLPIPEEAETDAQNPEHPKGEDDDQTEVDTITPKPSRRNIRRVMSHESLLSISGMDIHAPSRSFSSFDQRNPLSLVSTSPHTNAYSNPSLIAATATSSGFGKPNTTGGDLAKQLLAHHTFQHQQHHTSEEDKSLSKRMGGWVFGKWGAAPTASTSVDDLRARAATSKTPKAQDILAATFRAPGINQPGPIFGITKPQKTPTSVQPTTVNTDLLKESLEQI